jgi:hypothetical protein
MKRPLSACVAPRGFALVEAAATVLVCCLVISVLLLSANRTRRLSRLGEDFAHLRQIGQLTGAYGKDNADQYWTFSWKAGVAPINPSEPAAAGLVNAPTDLQAAANQFVYLLRTRGNRPQMPVISGVLPHISYSHLCLADYSGIGFPWRAAVSSEDRNRLLWSADPLGYDQGLYNPNLGFSPSPNINWRHPYSASLRIPTAFFDNSPVGFRIASGGATNNYIIPGTAMLGPTLMTSVAYPSLKVHVSDYIARHFGPRLPWCTSTEASLPFLMCDGTVDVKASKTANPGCDPNTGSPSSMTYLSSAIDPPATGANASVMALRFLYTRKLLAGRDFGGPEVPGF